MQLRCWTGLIALASGVFHGLKPSGSIPLHGDDLRSDTQQIPGKMSYCRDSQYRYIKPRLVHSINARLLLSSKDFNLKWCPGEAAHILTPTKWRCGCTREILALSLIEDFHFAVKKLGPQNVPFAKFVCSKNSEKLINLTSTISVMRLKGPKSLKGVTSSRTLKILKRLITLNNVSCLRLFESLKGLSGLRWMENIGEEVQICCSRYAEV